MMPQLAKLFFWRTKKRPPSKKQSKRSSTATHFCKVCFKQFKSSSWSLLFSNSYCLCDKCYKEFSPKISFFKVGKTSAISLFPYDEEIRSKLYQFKGCFDYELGEVFLSRVSPILKLYLQGYILLPAPSYHLKDEERGFNHVITMFSSLGLPIVESFEKTENIKQADLSSKDREKVGEIICWKEGVKIKGQKVCFVDDVYTTGSTCRACLNLIKKHHPKKVKVVVLAKTMFSRFSR